MLEKIIGFYVDLIKARQKALEDVPEKYRAAVEARLAETEGDDA